MRTSKKGTAFAALLMATLVLVGAACGGSSEKGSSTTGGSDSSATTSASSGGDASSCADLFNKTQELSSSLESSMTTASGSSSVDLSSIVTTLDSFTSSVPTEIRNDWTIIVAGITTYANSVKGIDTSNITDPATQQKLMDASAAMDDAKFLQATNNIDAWTAKNCPSYASK
jgi:hypothetical protein